jgi:hypothetical protein
MWQRLLVVAVILLAMPSVAGRRLGLFVGGASAAEHDAAQAMEVALRLLAIAPDDARLVRSPNAETLLLALQQLLTRADAGSTLWFFFAGPTNAQHLLIDGGPFPFSTLASLLKASPARLELQVLDIDPSGLTATVNDATTIRLPTRHFVWALAGGADTDGDRLVTLREVRHANGQSDEVDSVVLSQTSQAKGVAVPAVARDGRYRFINEQGASVVEFDRRCGPNCPENQFIALPDGRYRIERDGRFKPEVLTVGTPTASLSEGQQPRHWSARLVGSAQLPLTSGIPISGGGALEVTWHNAFAPHWSLGLDGTLSAGQALFDAGGASPVRGDFSLFTGGLSALYEPRRTGLWLPWFGVRVALFNASRTPVDAQLAAQNYTTAALGLTGGITYWLPGLPVLGLSGRVRTSVAPFAESSVIVLFDVGLGLTYRF